MRIYRENQIKDLDYIKILETIPTELENQELADVIDYSITYDEDDKKQIDIDIEYGLDEYTLVCGFEFDNETNEVNGYQYIVNNDQAMNQADLNDMEDIIILCKKILNV